MQLHPEKYKGLVFKLSSDMCWVCQIRQSTAPHVVGHIQHAIGRKDITSVNQQHIPNQQIIGADPRGPAIPQHRDLATTPACYY